MNNSKTAQTVKTHLQQLSSPDKAISSQRFFKTGPGQYGHDDKFVGVTVPDQRKIAKKFQDIPLQEVKKLLTSTWHEHRLTALFILIYHYNKAHKQDNQTTQQDIVNFYLRHTKYVNNWDLVDSSAHKILGPFLLQNPSQKKILYELAASQDLWQERISVLTTLAFINQGQFSDTLALAKLFLNHEHDLIHKAVGWMLREVGKKDLATEKNFLKKNYKKMPRVMLRYAIEKFPPALRKDYLQGRI